MEGESTTSSFPVQQFSIMLENRVGALASLVRLLNDNYIGNYDLFAACTVVSQLPTRPSASVAVKTMR